ncbi:MAG TPA: ATP-grasp domain-containing protein [Gemmatimonadaceae bacterium]|jgi:predicted ATP-grasp superfamily ATP-dependent carboligase|nr:ATP-grasp domain-containing protein [Gemmatimonadaceae bacterium]
MSSKRRTVLVTDGEQRAALAMVRSLGRAGHTVYVCSSSGQSLAGASRFVTREYRVSDPLHASEQFARDVRECIQSSHADTLIPISEASVLALLPVRETFDGVLIPFPDLDRFRQISDKAAVLAAAQQCGIAVPAQQRVDSPDEGARLDLEALTYPIVVKPARSVAGEAMARRKFSVVHAADSAELRRVLEECDPRAYPLLLQQRVIGPGVGIFLLLWGDTSLQRQGNEYKNDLVAAFSHRRLREKPPSGGVSVYRESIPLDPTLANRSRALLDAFGWTGVAMIEYKVDARTNVPYLMEINGRFWGSLQLAIDAGVDFPDLLIRAALGEHPTPVTTYRTDVRSRWWWGDVDHIVTRLRHSDRALALPPGSPSRWRAIRDFWARDPRDHNEIAQPDDRAPFFRETRQWFRRGA